MHKPLPEINSHSRCLRQTADRVESSAGRFSRLKSAGLFKSGLVFACLLGFTALGEDREKSGGRERRGGREDRGGRRTFRTPYKEIPAAVKREISFTNDVKPILLENCTRCHGAKKRKAELRLDTREGILAGAEDGPVIKPGNGEASLLVRSISGVGIESDEVMPPKDELLTKDEIAIIRAWIDQGAKFDSPGAAQK